MHACPDSKDWEVLELGSLNICSMQRHIGRMLRTEWETIHRGATLYAPPRARRQPARNAITATVTTPRNPVKTGKSNSCGPSQCDTT